MIQARLVWHGETVMEQGRKLAWDRISRAVLFLWTAVQGALHQKVNPPPYHNSSLPGEPPAIRTGWLAGHVLYDLDEKKLTGRVGLGPNALYGAFLESGTRFMAARPWLAATVKKVMPQLQAFMKV